MNIHVPATYADVFRPHEQTRSRLYDIALVLAGSVLIALSARVTFVLPFSPVPISGQTFAVLLLGALLGRQRGAAAVIAYLMQGIAGLPVFSGGLSGAAVLAGPTGGYLIGFVGAAYLTGWLAERGWDRRVVTTLLAMAAGNAVIYIGGVAWLTTLIGFDAALTGGLVPFIVGDVLKIVLAAALLPVGWRLLAATQR